VESARGDAGPSSWFATSKEALQQESLISEIRQLPACGYAGHATVLVASEEDEEAFLTGVLGNRKSPEWDGVLRPPESGQ
jgi:hypothetical protein